MKFGSSDFCNPLYACDVKDKRRFCLFMVILAFWFIAVSSCIVVIGADDIDAERFIVDEIKYRTISETSVEVMGCGDIGELVIPSVVAYSGKEYSIKSIRDAAFRGCKSMTSVCIPGCIKSISKNAFANCDNLASVIISNGTTSISCQAFYKCSSLKNVAIDNNVRSIGKSAFRGCNSLTSVIIPDNAVSIGKFAFADCTSLNSVSISKGIKSVNSNIFKNCTSLRSVILGSSMTSITSGLFKGCISLTSVTVGDSVASVDTSAFADCRSLTEIKVSGGSNNYCTVDGVLFNKGKTTLIHYPAGKTEDIYMIPDGIIFIADQAFYGCTSLASVTLPNTVTSIGISAFRDCVSLTSMNFGIGIKSVYESAFEDCKSLTTMTIPDSVRSLGNNAFKDCKSLKSVVIGEGVAFIDKSLFKGCKSLESVKIGNGVISLDKNLFKDCKSLRSVKIGNGVTCINASTFKGYKSLESVSIGDGVTCIDSSAFKDCKSLTSVKIGNGVRTIGKSAFSGCTSLASINIPDNVKTICECAFSKCRSLASVTIGHSLTSIRDQAFVCCKLTFVIVPKSVTYIGEDAFGACSFYDFNGTKKVYYSKLPGYIYFGESSSKLIRHELRNVFFDENGGSANISGMDVYEGDEFTLPAYNGVKTGHVFAGWSYNGNVYSPGQKMSKVSGDMKFTAVWASATFTVNGIDYKATSYTEVEVTGCDTSKSKDIVIPSSVTYINRTFSVTSVCGCAFPVCMTSVTIPDSIKTINIDAFRGCASLIGINVSEDNRMYCSVNGVLFNKERTTLIHYPSCNSSASYCIPDSVLSIGDSAFESCRSLTDVAISNSVKFIGNLAFVGCDSLTIVVIPSSVDGVGDYAFENCRSLASVTICNGVTSIGKFAFDGCTSLISVAIPSSVKSIGSHAFGCCAFYDFNGMTKIKDNHKLPGYTYFGDSPSKLIRHEANNVLFDENVSPQYVKGTIVDEWVGIYLSEYIQTMIGHTFTGMSYGRMTYSDGEILTKEGSDILFIVG